MVGAGPTGLITALGLAQAGIRVRVLEAVHEDAGYAGALTGWVGF